MTKRNAQNDSEKCLGMRFSRCARNDNIILYGTPKAMSAVSRPSPPLTHRFLLSLLSLATTTMQKEYKTQDITIIWKPELCKHAGECVRRLPVQGPHL